MSKNKLARFEENSTFPNLFQHTEYGPGKAPFPLRGNWNNDYFKNDNPVTLELGCGKGEYTIALSQNFPDRNYIGIDRKGARLWRGCKNALESQLDNVAFLRIGIDNIAFYFAPGEVSEIWITFPDPQPKKERRRLTSPNFIERYKQVLAKGGSINLKTDSRELYEYTLETARDQNWTIHENIDDVYARHDIPFLTGIQTFYEKIWLGEGKKIHYIKFSVS